MKTKQEVNEELRQRFGALLDTLETAVTEASDVLSTARINGRTGTQYRQLLEAIQRVSMRAYALDCKLGANP